MKKIAILLYACGIVTTCFSQNNESKIDSLEKQLTMHNNDDTIKINLLNNLAFTYSQVNPIKGIEYADKAIALAQKLNEKKMLATAYKNKGNDLYINGEEIPGLEMFRLAFEEYEQLNDKKGMALVCNNKAHLYFDKAENDKGFENAEKAYRLFEEIHDTAWMAKMLNTEGIAYNNISEFYKALENHQKAYSLFELLKDNASMAKAVNSIGVNYMKLSDYSNAVDAYLKALNLGEQTNDKKFIGNVYSNLGIVYEKLKSYTRALDYQNKALSKYDTLSNKAEIARCMNNIGIVYDDMSNSAKALEYYHKALTLNKELGNKWYVASNLTNIAIVYNDIEDYDRALEYLGQSVETYKDLGDKNNMAIALNEMGNIYSKATDTILKHHGIASGKGNDKAMELQEEALKIGQETGDISLQASVWEYLSETFERQKNYNKSLNAYKQFVMLRDSAVNDEKKEEITRKQMQFEFEKKEALTKVEHEKQQALAAAEIKRQRLVKNSAMAGVGILILAGGSVFVFYKRRRDALEQIKESDFKTQVSDTEMKALRSQMNPHFIFNSLNSINDYIDKNETRKATLFTTKFAKLMRMILENSEQKEISLTEELKALELYMQLEALRMNNKFSYEINVEKNIDSETTLIPPLMLQPFVENSIWHGISKRQGDGKIKIHIKKEGEMINCIIEDNGIGRVQSAAAKINSSETEKKSLGMKITKARIDILNKIKKSKAAIELSDLAEGMRVVIKLPLEIG
jgi:tetratricopeptide (TPR) repeat protein